MSAYMLCSRTWLEFAVYSVQKGQGQYDCSRRAISRVANGVHSTEMTQASNFLASAVCWHKMNVDLFEWNQIFDMSLWEPVCA